MGDKNYAGKENGNDDRSKTEWMFSIRMRLGMLTDERIKQSSISSVPESLQKSNVEAYKPKAVSIGPLHRGNNRNLLYMEDIKWQCMLSLLHRTDDPKGRLQDCGDAILELDELVRASYMDRIEVDSRELANIMLLDGCFLLELLISNIKDLNEELKIIYPAKHKKTKEVQSGPESEEIEEEEEKEEVEEEDQYQEEEQRQSGWELLEKHLRKAEVLSDLKLLENQIPLFIIDMLYLKLFKEKAKKDEVSIPKIINSYALLLFGCSSNRSLPVDSPNSVHVLELTHWFLTKKEVKERKPKSVGVTIEPEEQSPVIRLEETDSNHPATSRDKKFGKETIPNLERCAARLHAAGILIMSSAKTAEERRHVKFGCKKKFEQGKLEIQSLHFTEETEVLWRNFIALEETRATNKKFSEYALLFKGFVCCEHDIELLKTQNVLLYDTEKWSKEMMKEFIHNMVDGIQIDAITDSEFRGMIKELNEYKSPMGKHRIFMLKHHGRCFLTNTRYTFRYLYRILRQDHITTPWKAIGVIAAVLLLLLTVAQTVLAAIGL